jgi:HSP20 family protein
MTLTRYNPFADFDEFPTGIRLFQDAVGRLMSESAARPWSPNVDILETENELVVRADLPGIDMKNLDLRLEDGTLTLKGERKFEEENKGKGYHRIERGYGVFARSFSLPESVDPEKVKANYKDGVLTVTLPKKELAKPRKVNVEVQA